jgi:hypothetical protein
MNLFSKLKPHVDPYHHTVTFKYFSPGEIDRFGTQITQEAFDMAFGQLQIGMPILLEVEHTGQEGIITKIDKVAGVITLTIQDKEEEEVG